MNILTKGKIRKYTTEHWICVLAAWFCMNKCVKYCVKKFNILHCAFIMHSNELVLDDLLIMLKHLSTKKNGKYKRHAAAVKQVKEIYYKYLDICFFVFIAVEKYCDN